MLTYLDLKIDFFENLIDVFWKKNLATLTIIADQSKNFENIFLKFWRMFKKNMFILKETLTSSENLLS